VDVVVANLLHNRYEEVRLVSPAHADTIRLSTALAPDTAALAGARSLAETSAAVESGYCSDLIGERLKEHFEQGSTATTRQQMRTIESLFIQRLIAEHSKRMRTPPGSG
jgi:hypothetical protein